MKIGVIGNEERSLVVELDDNATVAISAERGPVKGLPASFSPTSAVDRARDGLRELQKLIIDAANTVAETIDSVVQPPSKVQLEFGVKFAGEGGVPALTKLSSEAAIRVTIEWGK